MRMRNSGKLAKRGSLLQWIREHINYQGDDCLLWPFKSRMTNGYPLVWWNGRKDGGHRVMCELAHGPSPSNDHEAAHSCGRGKDACIHPGHLRWALHVDNEADKLLHGSQIKGSKISWAKLTESDIPKIRSRFGRQSDIQIAREFGISDSSIYLIRKGRNWKHVR
jgi:hypothetical protein